MNIVEFAAILEKIAALVPTVISAGEKIIPLVENALTLFKSTTPPAQSDIDALHQTIADLTADIEDGA